MAPVKHHKFDNKFQKNEDLKTTIQLVAAANDRIGGDITRLKDQTSSIEFNPTKKNPDSPAIEQEKIAISNAEFEEFEQVEEEDPISDDFFQ